VAAAIGGAHGLGGVLQQRDVELLADGGKLVQVGALTVQVDHHHGAHPGPAPPAVGQGLAQRLRIHVPRPRLAVHKDGPRALVDGRADAADEGEAGADHLLARLEAQHTQPQVDGGGAGGERGGVAGAGDLAQVRLELAQVRPGGRDPVGGEGGGQEFG